jgi:chorismate mutase/prephenate dehydratase
MRLEESRKQIDEIDSQIVELLNRRASVSRRIGELKTRAGLPVVDPEREEIVLRKIVRDNAGQIDPGSLMRIYREVLEESRRIQTTVLLSFSPDEVTK